MKKVFVLLLCAILCSLSFLILPVMAETKEKLLFVCEKQEYVSSEALKWFVKSKEALGFETQTVVSPDVFNTPEAFRKLIASQRFFVVYAIGNLQFAETAVVKDYPFPISKIKWDAPYWWPSFEFVDRFYYPLPSQSPTIVARIPVGNVSELDSWLICSDVVSKELNGMFASAIVLNQQKSRLFPHFQYDDVSDSYSYSDFKTFKVLSEKRGKPNLRNGEQLTEDAFKKAFSTSNFAVVSSTADQVKEVYYKKEDMLFPVAKTRDVLATAYSDGSIKEEVFFSGAEHEDLGKNRVILLTNFYSDVSELDFIFDVSRCLITNYPGGLFFDITHEDRCRLQQEILKKFLSGKVLALAIQEALAESRTTTNEAKFDFVLWGDPLITMDSLTRSDDFEVVDLGFSRDFAFSNGEEIEFIDLPDFLAFSRNGEEYRFKCSLPRVVFFLFDDLVMEKSFLLEFQEKDTGKKGWIFLKLKIFNIWGIPKSPFYIVFNYFFCYNIFVGFN